MDILVTVISSIGAILVIGIIIMMHELGHYSIGRACKIKIVEFAVGFGPKIKQWVKNDIIYSIRWFFIGGFTKFYGEDEEASDKFAFNNQPAGRRALAIAAGPVFNILFAFVLVIFTLCVFGDFVPTVGEVWEGSPAEAAGLEPGDVIIEMNGVKMDFYMEITEAMSASDKVMMPITVLRGGEQVTLEIPYQYGLTDSKGVVHEQNMVGMSFTAKPVTYGFFEAIALSFKWMYFIIKGTIAAVIGLFAGRGTENAVGIVGIVTYLGDALTKSLQSVLQLGVVISVGLAVMNLLPLPALDGGRLVFIAIEKIFKKPVPRNVEGIIHFVGLVAFFLLFILITYRDIARILGG